MTLANIPTGVGVFVAMSAAPTAPSGDGPAASAGAAASGVPVPPSVFWIEMVAQW